MHVSINTVKLLIKEGAATNDYKASDWNILLSTFIILLKLMTTPTGFYLCVIFIGDDKFGAGIVKVNDPKCQ